MSYGYHPDYAPKPKLRVVVVPTLTVLLASVLTAWPAIVSAPLLPPLGFMILLGWRLLRGDVWPVWAGLPLGLVDDLYSGNPVGTAMFSWTVVLVILALLDTRIVYRSWWLEWLMGALALGFVLLVGGLLARAGALPQVVMLIGPQWVLSALLLPLLIQLLSLFDRWRLR